MGQCGACVGGGFVRGLDKAFLSPLGGAADVSRCVKAGADVNARDSIRNTPLYKAARYSKKARHRLLPAGKGEDIFVVNDETGAMWRLQVKTSSGRQQSNSWRYQFRIRETAIQTPLTPDLHFVFAMRRPNGWRFMILSRDVLRNYVASKNLGVLNKGYRQIAVTLDDEGTAICSKQDFSTHLENWHTWP